MIDYCIASLVKSLELLRSQEQTINTQIGDYHKNLLSRVEDSPELFDSTADQICAILKPLRDECKTLEIEEGVNQIDALIGQIRRPTFLLYDCAGNLKSIRETIDRNLKDTYFYRYPRDKAKLLLRVDEDWREVFVKFRSAKEDAKSAVDCYAIGHHAASVFHLMRVVERGLHALARERGVTLKKPIEYEKWGTVIGETKKKCEEISNWKAGPSRDKARSFYNEALSHFEYFKDEHRNHVSHSRGIYDEHRNRSVLEHVREFMLVLSTQLGDDTTGPIDWNAQ